MWWYHDSIMEWKKTEDVDAQSSATNRNAKVKPHSNAIVYYVQISENDSIASLPSH